MLLLQQRAFQAEKIPLKKGRHISDNCFSRLSTSFTSHVLSHYFLSFILWGFPHLQRIELSLSVTKRLSPFLPGLSHYFPVFDVMSGNFFTLNFICLQIGIFSLGANVLIMLLLSVLKLLMTWQLVALFRLTVELPLPSMSYLWEIACNNSQDQSVGDILLSFIAAKIASNYFSSLEIIY